MAPVTGMIWQSDTQGAGGPPSCSRCELPGGASESGAPSYGALWVEVGVSKWIKLGRDVERVRLFDGGTAPPREFVRSVNNLIEPHRGSASAETRGGRRMASRIRKVMGALALVGAIQLGVGCRGGDDNGSERTVEWGVDRAVGPKKVRLSAEIEYCSEVSPPFEKPIIEYIGDRAYIELRVAPEELEEGQSGCLLSLVVAYTTITLERDLNELVLLDASTDPPERRWPS